MLSFNSSRFICNSKNYNGDIGIEGYQWKYEAGLIAQEINELDDLSFAAMESYSSLLST